MRRASILLILTLTLLAACDDQETTSVVENHYSAITVYRAWWLVTAFADPVAAESSSGEHRVVAGTDTAYFILAPGWDPESGPPTTLVAAKSRRPLQAVEGSALHIAVDDADVVGNCAAGEPLTQADADFITQRIFDGEFAGYSYDAATCTLTAASAGDAAGGDAADD